MIVHRHRNIWIVLSVAVTLALVLAACGGSSNDGDKGLRVAARVDRTSGDIPLTIQLTDASKGDVIGWEWDFGDGSPRSLGRDPAHTYLAAGVYTVSLTITAADGSRASGAVAEVRAGAAIVSLPATTPAVIAVPTPDSAQPVPTPTSEAGASGEPSDPTATPEEAPTSTPTPLPPPPTPTPTREPASVALQASSEDIPAGASFTVSVVVNTEGHGLSGMDVTLVFDPGALAVTSVELGDVLGAGAVIGRNFIDNQAGVVHFAAARVGRTVSPTPAGVVLHVHAVARQHLTGAGSAITVVSVALTHEALGFISPVSVQ